MPLTLAAGVMAYVSVSSMPSASAPSRSKSFRFSLWSGQAGYPNAGRIPRKRSAISCSGASFGPVSYHARRASSCTCSARASASRSASALTMIAW